MWEPSRNDFIVEIGFWRFFFPDLTVSALEYGNSFCETPFLSAVNSSNISSWVKQMRMYQCVHCIHLFCTIYPKWWFFNVGKNLKPQIWMIFFFKFGVSYNLFVPCFLGCVWNSMFSALEKFRKQKSPQQRNNASRHPYGAYIRRFFERNFSWMLWECSFWRFVSMDFNLWRWNGSPSH